MKTKQTKVIHCIKNICLLFYDGDFPKRKVSSLFSNNFFCFYCFFLLLFGFLFICNKQVGYIYLYDFIAGMLSNNLSMTSVKYTKYSTCTQFLFTLCVCLNSIIKLCMGGCEIIITYRLVMHQRVRTDMALDMDIHHVVELWVFFVDGIYNLDVLSCA